MFTNYATSEDLSCEKLESLAKTEEEGRFYQAALPSSIHLKYSDI